MSVANGVMVVTIASGCASSRPRLGRIAMTVHVTESSAGVLAQLPAWVTLVRAPNPGPMTLDGTNTWVLRAPSGDAIVVDPGPLDEGHLAAVAGVGSVRTVITTHHHLDHTEGLARLLELCPSARVWRPVAEGGDSGEPSVLRQGGLELRCIPTPGHTADSVTLIGGVGDERVVLTGDTILGRGTTVIAEPDGDLGDYLASLRLLELLGPLPVLPGHGPALTDVGAAAAFYLRHRLARLDQIRAVLATGVTTAREVVEIVYADVDPALWPAAEASVRAQLAYLAAESAGADSTGARSTEARAAGAQSTEAQSAGAQSPGVGTTAAESRTAP
jgi:glyoxylase-like metal-dependent hydrolase (beta-lactamase superfamily II)